MPTPFSADRRRFLSCSLLAMPALAAVPAFAASDNARALDLLARAAALYQRRGDAALPAFQRGGAFDEAGLYVYVLGADGVLKASGGPSEVFIGQDVRGHRDREGGAYIATVLERARADAPTSLNYRWTNRRTGQDETKTVHFRRVGEAVIVVSQMIDRATATEARAWLARAVKALEQRGPAVLAEFNDVNGAFVQDDLYVFAIGANDMVMHAHGTQPRLVGRNVTYLKDANRHFIGREMVRRAKVGEVVETRYVWLNPVTRHKEPKTTFVQRVGQLVLAVGYYGA